MFLQIFSKIQATVFQNKIAWYREAVIERTDKHEQTDTVITVKALLFTWGWCIRNILFNNSYINTSLKIYDLKKRNSIWHKWHHIKLSAINFLQHILSIFILVTHKVQSAFSIVCMAQITQITITSNTCECKAITCPWWYESISHLGIKLRFMLSQDTKRQNWWTITIPFHCHLHPLI